MIVTRAPFTGSSLPMNAPGRGQHTNLLPLKASWLLPWPGMSTQAFNGAYLLPLFSEIEQARADGAYRPLPAPAPASSQSTPSGGAGRQSQDVQQV